jgi:hypothetical protein
MLTPSGPNLTNFDILNPNFEGLEGKLWKWSTDLAPKVKNHKL